MASPIGHSVVGVGLAALVVQMGGAEASPIFWLGAIVASNLPDIDLIGLTLGLPFQRAHRQATHSLLLLAALFLAVWLLHAVSQGPIPSVYFVAWGVALLAHPLLDVVTTGPTDAAAGFGIPLFWPLSARRWALCRPLFRSAPIRAYRSIKTLSAAIVPELTWCAAFAMIWSAVMVVMTYFLHG
jgi:membrane-bound metal-dependent hydrolase YbcI (DUF457 family)